tara:strand:- start:507 stop:857 length:351 start_codon:yes stop_codon:yes gene_type:complete
MEDYEDKIEKASLLPDRYYIILRQGDEPDIFSVMAYDTNDHEDEYDTQSIPSAMAIQHGLLSYLRDNVHELFEKGIASIAFNEVAKSMIVDIEDGEGLLPKDLGDNVVKVDFGKKQ